jgi:DNA repair exonuclease SbcCD nuclease subunit
MKIAILGDMHLGVRNDSPNFHALQDKFYTNIFIPYLLENDIKVVCQLGDMFDRRKYINFNTLSECKRFFFQPLQESGIELHTLLGNHDLYYRESLSVNSTGLLLGEFTNITIYDEPTKVIFDDTSIDIIPWICKENVDEAIEFIRDSNSDLCFGHLEILGFSMYKGMESHDGIAGNLFAKYEGVYSGHFHTKSDKENIHYVGTPYEMTWSDYNDQKGFHIFDTETRQTEFIKNPYTMFLRHEYNDELVDYEKIDIEQFQQKYIKIVVVKKTDYYKFDQFLKKLYESNTYEIKILEDLSDFSEGVVDTTQISIENTLEVLEGYVDSVADDTNRDKIKSFMKSLYLDAKEVI